MSRFEIRDVPLRDTVVVTVTTPPEGIADAMGRAIGQAFTAAEHAGVVPTGPPYARYFHLGVDRIEFEAGVPVDHAAPSDNGARPGCSAAAAPPSPSTSGRTTRCR